MTNNPEPYEIWTVDHAPELNANGDDCIFQINVNRLGFDFETMADSDYVILMHPNVYDRIKPKLRPTIPVFSREDRRHGKGN